MKMPGIMGVSQISDAYPNTKYKIQILESLIGDKKKVHLFHLPEKQSFSNTANSSLIKKLIFLFLMVYGHLTVLAKGLLARQKSVYIPYPGVFMVLLLSFIPEKFRPNIFLDAFISIYDTSINDRKIFSPDSFVAKILYTMERRAFSCCKKIITDTHANSIFYSRLFKLPEGRFISVPLSIPEHRITIKNGTGKTLTCLFVGSFVPLQGTRYIIDAAKILKENPDIHFIFIGEGQDAHYLEEALDNHPGLNITWHKGWFSNAFIEEHIGNADICLGIFGETAKAQRVIPLKIYHYLACGQAIITGESPCIQDILEKDAAVLFTTPMANGKGLAQKILELFKHRTNLPDTRKHARKYYQENLSHHAIQTALIQALCESPD